MKLLAIICAIIAVSSYADAACEVTSLEFVVAQIIEGPQELIEAILTDESLRTPEQIALVEAKKAEIKAMVIFLLKPFILY